MKIIFNVPTQSMSDTQELSSVKGKLRDLVDREDIYRNLTPAELYEQIIKNGEGVLTADYAVRILTGKYTGRSPKDRFIVDTHISGNPDEADAVLLHEKAWGKLEDHFQKDRQKAKEDFELYLSKDKASFSIPQIVPAAINGQVDRLFLNKDAQVWGNYIAETNEVTIHEERKGNSMPLLELAAKHTFLNGGKVYNVPKDQLPQATGDANAVFRYEMGDGLQESEANMREDEYKYSDKR